MILGQEFGKFPSRNIRGLNRYVESMFRHEIGSNMNSMGTIHETDRFPTPSCFQDGRSISPLSTISKFHHKTPDHLQLYGEIMYEPQIQMAGQKRRFKKFGNLRIAIWC